MEVSEGGLGSGGSGWVDLEPALQIDLIEGERNEEKPGPRGLGLIRGCRQLVGTLVPGEEGRLCLSPEGSMEHRGCSQWEPPGEGLV